MPSPNSGAGRGGLFRQLALPFSAFVLAATLAMVAWIDVSHRREALRQFAETAGANARFVESLRLPRSSELAQNLATVLGFGVGFYRKGEDVFGLEGELLPLVKSLAGSGPTSLRSGQWDLAVAPLADESTHLVLVREADSFFPGTATWLLPTLIVTALGGGLASLVARRIVSPLATLTRWLPNLDRDDPEPLPPQVTDRADEIGTPRSGNGSTPASKTWPLPPTANCRKRSRAGCSANSSPATTEDLPASRAI